jgi:catechol 2,3-dioxygenase-like lactoylglutathione lyase family enzyme
VAESNIIPILNVSNMEESFAWFEKLGWRKLWDWGDPPTFGAVRLGGGEVFLCRDGQGGRGRGSNTQTFGADDAETGDKGVWMSVFVDDVDEVHERCVAAGIEITWPPTDEPWGVREMHVRHPDGHVFRIGTGLMPKEPKLEIERVDVPVRLEKRLAALLEDLAQYKKMTIGEVLEETLLHTFEKLDSGGVASPHTDGQLARIQQLKEKHGIDYDCHASYRFVERS